ncbi:c-type cytochrome domain-containing protein [Lunatimonas salinarum]|uniref:c-type cytochrome domain-containing protein n=1 Tax=Lunatimonas salinarum TaxID=1774590 RepID=UPI001AE094CE|nr:c-type cytochrome domain-containing protein [Lunatimonas salinarum]
MITEKWKTIAGQVLFAAHAFVLVLVFAEGRLAIPDWLHVFGRLHPLLLHFPIVILLLALVLLLVPHWAKTKEDGLEYGENLLLLGCLTTAFTVIAGLFLSHEPGYDQEQLLWHKWSGLAVFWLASLLYTYLHQPFPVWQKAGMGVIGVSLLVSGHLGASITHGEGFVTAPLASEAPLVALEDAEVFAHVVMPILEQKCVSCHKASKQKGGLRMDKPELLQRGGDSGPAFVENDPQGSLLVQRILLPLEDEEHMPPKGKPQLSEEEIALLEAWIANGSDLDRKLVAYSDTSSIFLLAATKFTNAKSYDFKAADANTVKGLNNFYRKVQALGMDSPALSVSYFGRSVFDPQSLSELKDIYQQTVSINLNNMPLKDEDMAILGNFPNLERLFLNFTDISGEGIKSLKELEQLRLLSLSGNALDEAAITHLSELKKLTHLYIWNTGLEDAQLQSLKSALPNTTIETGYKDDGTVYQLNPPVIKFDRAFFKDKMEVKIQHPIQGTSIFYTLDGTEPDSSNHILYQGPLEITENLTLKARAFAPGWTGSDPTSAEFIQSAKSPKNYTLKYPPADRYKGDGASSLFDGNKAVKDSWNLNWLGFRFTPLEVEMEFEEPTPISDMALSIWYNSGGWMFPPQEIEIWSKKGDADEWKLETKHRPSQPKKEDPGMLTRVPIPFQSEDTKFLKLVAHPIAKLPEWHGAKGQQGWIMVDELVIN